MHENTAAKSDIQPSNWHTVSLTFVSESVGKHIEKQTNILILMRIKNRNVAKNCQWFDNATNFF